ncbi:MAG TPA: homoserine dehydrogenase [Acidobacteriota bacterium]|nr:homoserine dehydrogenase [Acidobacteriota bacterium]
MKTMRLQLLGLGGVGRTLMEQVLESRSFHLQHLGLRLEMAAICDSSGTLAAPSDAALEKAIESKRQGRSLADLKGGRKDDPLELLRGLAAPDLIAVDCTAGEDTGPALAEALERGAGVVLANKKPLTGPLDLYRRLTPPGGRSRWESTVASGVPVIATLNRLRAGNDRIERIQGATSGTLGRLMTGLQQGRPFSRLVQEAHRQGATEPDPRDDLGGRDVARKALILARGMGLALDLEDVQVESLYPAHLDTLSIDEFLDALQPLDSDYARRSQEALKNGHTLRYMLSVTPGEVRAGLSAVPLDSPLARLRGNDNLIEFHTRHYPDSPLLLQGRGNGLQATANGTLSDIIELCRPSIASW